MQEAEHSLLSVTLCHFVSSALDWMRPSSTKARSSSSVDAAVIYLNDDGEHQIELMRWAFKLPDRLLFNARSEGIERSKFWKGAFQVVRSILPGDAIYEWQEVEKGKKKPRYEFTIPGQHPFGMAAAWKLWKNPKTDHWEKIFAVLTGEPIELMV